MDGAEKRGVIPWVILGVLIAGAGVLLLSVTNGIGFVTDEWNLLFLRPGWTPDSFLQPFHEHIIIAPTLIYKVLQTTLGMDSHRPFQVAAIATFLTVGLLLFVWARRRVGDPAALIAVAIVLFLGAAFEDLLWAFQIGYFGSLACGLGALIALDRDDRRGDLVAAILLVASLSFSSLGMPFVAGAAAEWLTNPRDRRRRWAVPAAGLGFYVLWWLGWGHEAESAISLSNLPGAPRFVFDAASAGVTSLLGLATGDGSEPDQPHLIWGRLGLILLLVLSAWRLWKLRHLPAGVVITGVIALTFFGLAALGQTDLRLPTSSRYQLPGALFLLLFFIEVLRGIELKPPVLAAAAAVVLLTSLSGVHLMKDQADSRWIPSTVATSTFLGAVAYADGGAQSDLVLNLGPGSEIPIDRFLNEVASSGSPGYSAAQIEAQDAAQRAAADQTLIQYTGAELTANRPPIGFRRCRQYVAGSTAQIDPSASTVEVRSLGPNDLSLGLSRFGDPPGYPIGSVLAGSKAWLYLPTIEKPPPWELTGDGPFAICR